jgi:hypothetical protein
MAKTLRNRRGDDKEPLQGRAAPYRRPQRGELDPTPALVAEALKGACDLGACGRRLKQAFPQWSEAERLSALRQYLIGKQYKWQADPGRKGRERIARQSGVPFVAPDGGLDGERIAEELAAAKSEIDELERDNFKLEEERDALEDQLEALNPPANPGG